MSVHSVIRLLEVLPDDIGLICLQYSLRDDERELLEQYDNVYIPDHDFFEEVDLNALYAGCCDLVLTAGTVNPSVGWNLWCPGLDLAARPRLGSAWAESITRGLRML